MAADVGSALRHLHHAAQSLANAVDALGGNVPPLSRHETTYPAGYEYERAEAQTMVATTVHLIGRLERPDTSGDAAT